MAKEGQGNSKTGGAGRVNSGYPAFQLAKALTTEEEHPDPAVRQRARQRILKWTAVLDGLLNGRIDAGSRTPLPGVPAWVTLEVVTGGFATGQFLAGGPLLDHERAMLDTLPKAPDSEARRVLNAFYLTDRGLADLQARLRSGCYQVAVPEEGALTVAAWLALNGHADQARDLLEELGPWLSRLRFYPVPTDRPARLGSQVFRQDVGQAIEDLGYIQPNLRLLAQQEALTVWIPLYDRLVSLFLETVDGPVPNLSTGPDGRWTRSPEGRFPVEGGWPCRHFPEDWAARGEQLLLDYQEALQKHRLCHRPVRRKDSLYQLAMYLGCCVIDPASLTGREVGRIRLILARYVAKRGRPDAPACRALRTRQTSQAHAPTFHDIARVVMARLEGHPQNSGLEDIGAITEPISAAEAEQWAIPDGTRVPDSQKHKVERCLMEDVDVLVERGLISSGDVLAQVLPQLTSGIQALGIENPGLRHLYAAIYRAFRQRRSLLLLNLEKQIRIEELPWVRVIDGFRKEGLSAVELARQTLEEVVTLAITSFPQAILPNKLLQELRALAKTARLNMPLVDEIAADIFMGVFSDKFLMAAQTAAELLDGTLYAAYYGIDYQLVRTMPATKPAKRLWFRKTVRPTFIGLCESRAGVAAGGWDPAVNGMIIEQQQILTTQNLAVLFKGLDLTTTLGGRLEELAKGCFSWICRRPRLKVPTRHALLIQVKNMAYAWRQMVFFLALLPQDRVTQFLAWADQHLDEQPEPFRTRFLPALKGLALAAQGRSLESEAAAKTGARRFLGWSKQEHWLFSGLDPS